MQWYTYESCTAPWRRLFFLACLIGFPSSSTIKSSTSEQRSWLKIHCNFNVRNKVIVFIAIFTVHKHYFISFPQFIYDLFHISFNTHFFHGNIWTHNWPAPSVSGFIAQLVEHRTGNREVTGSNPIKVLNFLQASLRNCINCVHCNDHFFIFKHCFFY